jgi:Pyridoxamine 5'-phosphate oxidase
MVLHRPGWWEATRVRPSGGARRDLDEQDEPMRNERFGPPRLALDYAERRVTTMPTIFPAKYADLLEDDLPATLILTTLRRDGMPVLAPVWFVAEGKGLLMVVDPASLKVKHIRNDPRVAAVILAPHEHNRYLHLHGEARERPDLDVQALYRRILWKYEHREPDEQTALILVEVLPSQVRGFDYRDPPASEAAGA